MAEENNDVFPLGKENYKFIIAGMAIVIVGFFAYGWRWIGVSR